jgi:hypothetical protein
VRHRKTLRASSARASYGSALVWLAGRYWLPGRMARGRYWLPGRMARGRYWLPGADGPGRYWPRSQRSGAMSLAAAAGPQEPGA